MAATAQRTNLWRHSEFLKLWSAQTISLFGTQIGRFALPLVAIFSLNASSIQVATLGAAGVAPGLALGLFAGVWVDRLRRRPLLIAADLGRALALATVPIAYWVGVLGMAQLYAVAIVTSALSILFEVAYRSYLPSLVGREDLVEGNSKLAATDSIAEMGGVGLAGVIVQALGAPVGVLVDAVSFVASAVALGLIRTPERAVAVARGEGEPSTLREIGEGLRAIWRDPILRPVVGAGVADIFFIHFFVAVLTLFFVRELGLSPLVIGFIIAIGGISSFLGALITDRVVHRWGLGRTFIVSNILYRVFTYAIPFAAGPYPVKVAILSASQVLDAAATVQQIAQNSLIQTTAPERVLGRVNASFQTLQQGAILVGFLIGGVLGEWIGLRATMLVGITASMLSLLWFVGSPVMAVPTRPEGEGE
jgi:MFS family permease